MKPISKIMPYIALVAAMAVMGYVFYLRYSAQSPLFPEAPLTNFVVAIAVAVFATLIYYEFWGSTVTTRPKARDLSADVPSPPVEARKSRSPAQNLVQFLAFLLMTAAYYLRHADWSHDKTLWPDIYWPVILSISLALVLGFWLYDTLFGRLINGSHSGRSGLSLRTGLIAKRVAVLLLALGVLMLLSQNQANSLQVAYRNEAAAIMLNSFWATLTSLALISR